MLPAQSKLRLLLADDHPSTLDEVRSILSSEFEVLAAVQTGTDLVNAAQRLFPDVVVTDISMPGINGIEAAGRIIALGCCDAVVILSATTTGQFVRMAFESGVRAYVAKEDAGEELIDAVRAAAVGKIFQSSNIPARGEPLGAQSD